MRRLFWLALGVTLGIWIALRLKRLVRAWTPSGIAGQAAGIGRSLRVFTDDVRAAADEREAQLREALGLDELETPDHDKDGQ